MNSSARPLPSTAIDSSKSRIILCRFNGRGDNLGDQLIFKCLCDELHKHGEVVLYGPEAPFLGQQSLRFKQAFFAALKGRMQGNMLFRVDPPGARLASGRRLDQQPFKNRLIDALLRSIGTKRVRYGISLSAGMTGDDMHGYDWIGVRDMTSLELLQASGAKDVHFYPDLAFLLEPQRRDAAFPPKALLSFRATTPDDSRPGHSALVESALPIVMKILTGQGIKPSFYHQVKEDQEFNRALASALHNTDFISETVPSLADLPHYYGDKSYIISNRLHVLLTGAAFGALPIALITRQHQKLDALYTAMGWQALIVYIDEPATQQARIKQILKARRELAEHVHSSFKQAGDEVRSGIRHMLTGAL